MKFMISLVIIASLFVVATRLGVTYASTSPTSSSHVNTEMVTPVENGFTFDIPVPQFITVPVTITSSAPKSHHHVAGVTSITKKLTPKVQRDLVQGSGSVIISEY